MNDKIAKGMIAKMETTDTKLNYVSLKSREEELLAQLKVLRAEIEIAEKNIVTEKLNIAIQYLVDVDEMTSGYYRCTIETYCEGCETDIDVDVHLAEIIEALQQIK